MLYVSPVWVSQKGIVKNWDNFLIPPESDSHSDFCFLKYRERLARLSLRPMFRGKYQNPKTKYK